MELSIGPSGSTFGPWRLAVAARGASFLGERSGFEMVSNWRGPTGAAHALQPERVPLVFLYMYAGHPEHLGSWRQNGTVL